MKLKMTCSLITLVLILAALLLPVVVVSSIPTVDYVLLKKINYENTVDASGSIQSKGEREIYLQTPVLAQEVLVEVGDPVTAGQPMIKIDQELTMAVLAGEKEADPEELKQIDEETLLHYAQLYQISPEEIEKYLKQQTVLAEQTETEKIVPQKILAPSDGIVTQVNVSDNVITRTDRPLICISDPKQYYAKLQVNEGKIEQISVGDRVRMSGKAFPNQFCFGMVSKIYPTARIILNALTQETVVDLEIELDSTDINLKPGFTVSAEILTEPPRELLTLAYEAIWQDEENREYVYVYESGRARKRYITTGIETTYGAEIQSGLEEDSIVLITDEIEDGTRVKLGSEMIADRLH